MVRIKNVTYFTYHSKKTGILSKITIKLPIRRDLVDSSTIRRERERERK